MRSLLFLMIFFVGLSLAAPAGQSDRPTAFDAAEILSKNGGQLSHAAIKQIFSTAFGANMRIPPEHLGVIFFNRRTGKELDHAQVRELLGPVRQDGARELIEMAASLTDDQLPMEPDQLSLLLDAAFIASMRVPPKHIDIEFYDRRHGPTGKPDGGMSGRVPDEMTQSPLKSSQPVEDPYAALPTSAEELAMRVRAIGLKTPPKEEMVTFVVPLLGEDAASREKEMRDFNTFLKNDGIFIAQRGDRGIETLENGQQIRYQVVYLQGESEALARIRDELAALQ
jgi:hypothetical protein